MRNAAWLLIGALVLCLPACRKPRPSPEYLEASGSYSTLTAKLGDDAYDDPEMARIESLLSKVPGDSLDAAAAKDLQGKIASERKRVADEAAAHKRLLENAERPSVMIDSPHSPDEPVAQQVVDAGPKRIVLGLSTEEVSKLGDDCFHFTQNMRVRNPDGTEADGSIWERTELLKCKDAFPDFGARMLVFEDNKLMQIVDKAQIRREVLDAGSKPQPPTEPKPEAPAPPGGGGVPLGEPPTDQPPPVPTKLPPGQQPGENTAPAPTE